MSKKKIKAVIGIDPGADGAMVLIPKKGKPVILHGLNGINTMNDWMKRMNKKYEIIHCNLENVHALPKVSAKSNFNFGFNLCLCVSVLQLNKIPYDTISPAAWHKAIGLKKTGLPITAYGRQREIKKRIAKIAQNLYPNVELFTPRGKLLDGISDALAIATEARFKYLTKGNKKG